MVFVKALLIRLRALWFAASIVSSVWFLYWICYDVLVWNKALTQARPANYVGLIVSLALAVLSTQFGKRKIFGKLVLSPEQKINKPATENKQIPEREQIVSSEQIQETQPAEETRETLQVSPGSSVPPGCRYYLGYLHTRPESVEIPEECLECEHVVNCLSPTASAINARM